LFDDWQTTLILHTLATLFVAVPAAVCHSVLRRHHGHTEPAHFSLRQLCMGTGILALAFGLLAWYGVPAVVSYAVVLMFCGWPTMLILAGIISRGRLAHPSTGSDETDETSADPG
jgi:predicted membrane metal-binding protein